MVHNTQQSTGQTKIHQDTVPSQNKKMEDRSMKDGIIHPQKKIPKDGIWKM